MRRGNRPSSGSTTSTTSATATCSSPAGTSAHASPAAPATGTPTAGTSPSTRTRPADASGWSAPPPAAATAANPGPRTNSPTYSATLPTSKPSPTAADASWRKEPHDPHPHHPHLPGRGRHAAARPRRRPRLSRHGQRPGHVQVAAPTGSNGNVNQISRDRLVAGYTSTYFS